MCIRKVMGHYRFTIVVLALCALPIALTSFHFIHTADSVASFTGYIFSLAILPMSITLLLPVTLLLVVSNNYGDRQKRMLVAIPFFVVVSFLAFTYYAVQYGAR